MVAGAAWRCWVGKGFMNSGGCGGGCCQCGSMGTRVGLYIFEWMGRCESSKERFERRKVLYAVLMFHVSRLDLFCA